MMSHSVISEILGNKQRLDGGAMFGNAPRAVWESWVMPDERSRIPLECRAMLIETQGQRILCETGIGAFFDPKLADRYGVSEQEHKLLLSLRSLGLSENDIDYVILSHLHFDHAGGLLPPWSESQGPAKRLLFPKAKYVVGSEALQRGEFPHHRDRASFIPELIPLLKSSGRLIVVEGDRHPEVLPENISFFYSHGHTPGHMHTVFKGQKGTVIFAGDLIPGRAWVHLPITMGYDRFAEQVIDEKLKLYRSITAKSDTWVFFTHDHEVSMARIAVDAKGKYIPIETVAHPLRWEI